MTYNRRALGALPETTWCSDQNPQGTCKPLTNICIPMDAATLEIYKGLQRQANRILAATGKKLLKVDGRIGPLTMSAVGSIVGRKYQHCDYLAASADDILTYLTNEANKSNMPVVADPAGAKPSVPMPDGTVKHPPGIQTAGLAGLPWWLLLAMGVGGYVVFKSLEKKPAKKKPAKKRRTTRRRKPRRRIVQTWF